MFKRLSLEQLKRNARAMRADPPAAERIFHYKFKQTFPHIRIAHQHIMHPYIVDFYLPDHNIIIEIDGGQHCENKADIRRDRRLARKGYTIIRYWNTDIHTNISGALENLSLKIK